MNSVLKDQFGEMDIFGKNWLKENLALCNVHQQHLFKQMYSHGNLNMDINDVIDAMPDDKVDWAMQQVMSTKKEVKDV